MIWSTICEKGLERLYIVEGMMNQVQYVLEQKLIPQLAEWFCEKKIFMKDGATSHIIKVN